MDKKIELLAPVGSLANLKAAVSRQADAVYLGMTRFSARQYATNFNDQYLKEAVQICKSNQIKLYLTMNTLIKNHELKDFFNQLDYAYSQGIDAVIIQEISFLDFIKKKYPDLRVHISTQAGLINSAHAHLLQKADRFTLARELTKDELQTIRKNVSQELEVFCHGALCVSLSGACLFSSLLGGHSGNRGQCAQLCRKYYHHGFLLSTKELQLIDQIPELIKLGLNSLKIEGRMRTPYYVATVTEVYRQAIDSYYQGRFQVTPQMKAKLQSAFSRDFTQGWFMSENIFNPQQASGQSSPLKKEFYQVAVKNVQINRKKITAYLPFFPEKKSQAKQLLVRAYTAEDALAAAQAGADLIYFDLFDENFSQIKAKIKIPLFAVTPRIILDEDLLKIKKLIQEKKPAGLLAGNLGLLDLKLDLPIHLDYHANFFNDFDLNQFPQVLPIISPELSLSELKQFQNKNFAVLVHGQIRLMTLRHQLKEKYLLDDHGVKFLVNPIYRGTEIINEKELGLLGKSSQLINSGITQFFIDTPKNISSVVQFYRKILDSQKVEESLSKKDYVLGWSYHGVH